MRPEDDRRDVARRAGGPALVLFDMDDTIFDHSLTCRDALGEVRDREVRLQSIPLDRLWAEYLGLLNAPTPPGARPGGSAATRADRFRRLGQICGWAVGPDTAEELSRDYRARYQRLRRPVPGAVDFVRRVAIHRRVGIVTNNAVAEQEEKLRFLGLEGVIDPLVVSEAVGHEKPAPEIFRAALGRAGVPPRSSIMIGDSWTNDVLGARACGIRPVWFNRFGTARPAPLRVAEWRTFDPLPADARRLLRS